MNIKSLLQSCQQEVQLATAVVFFCIALAGCSTKQHQPQYASTGGLSPGSTNSIVLREGDVLNIKFPGAPQLSTSQTIRRDGKITLSGVGEVTAAGLTPNELQDLLLKLYAKDLLDKTVEVAVQSSSFPVFVTGAVARPGKILSDRPITALEAILEAGGFAEATANRKDVTVSRNVNGHMEHFKLNLKDVLNGSSTQVFYLQPADIVFVPTRFSWL